MKAIVVKHSTLTSGQITAAMAAFDVCLVSPPDSGSLTLNQPLTAYTCMAKSLESNVSLPSYHQRFESITRPMIFSGMCLSCRLKISSRRDTEFLDYLYSNEKIHFDYQHSSTLDRIIN